MAGMWAIRLVRQAQAFERQGAEQGSLTDSDVHP
jgi:hypothetical protein